MRSSCSLSASPTVFFPIIVTMCSPLHLRRHCCPSAWCSSLPEILTCNQKCPRYYVDLGVAFAATAKPVFVHCCSSSRTLALPLRLFMLTFVFRFFGVQVLRRYLVQNRDDYVKYNKIVGLITKLTARLKVNRRMQIRTSGCCGCRGTISRSLALSCQIYLAIASTDCSGRRLFCCFYRCLRKSARLCKSGTEKRRAS